MKNMALSSIVIGLLLLSGCGGDGTTKTNDDNKTTLSKQTLTPKSIEEGTLTVFNFLNAGVSYKITGGEDKDYFRMNKDKLEFKTAQNYNEGGDNTYKVEVEAKDENGLKKGTLLYITTNIIPSGSVVIDTNTSTKPVFPANLSPLTLTVGSSKSIAASHATVYGLTGSGFSLDNSGILTAGNTAGDYNITVTATSAANESTSIALITHIVSSSSVAFSTVLDQRATWDEAKNICSNKNGGTWALPTMQELLDNKVKIFPNFSSDANSSAAFHSLLWSSEEDGNVSVKSINFPLGTAASGVESGWNRTESIYYTCIKRN